MKSDYVRIPVPIILRPDHFLRLSVWRSTERTARDHLLEIFIRDEVILTDLCWRLASQRVVVRTRRTLILVVI